MKLLSTVSVDSVLESHSRQNTLTISSMIFASFIPLYFHIDEGSAVRLFLYVVPFMFFFEALTITGPRLKKIPAFLLLVFALSHYVRAASGFTEFKEFIFILLSFFVAVLSFRVPDKFIIAILMAGVATVLITIITSNTGEFGMLIMSSKGFAESSLGLIIPLVAILFFMQRRWFLFLVGFFITFLMFKRIALGAMVVVLLFDHLSLFTKHVIIVRALKWGLFAIALIVSLNSTMVFVWLSNLVSRQLDITVSADALSSGRYNATIIFLQKISHNRTWLNWFFGFGSGYSTSLLQTSHELVGKNFQLLHNDFLRILVDYGVLGLSAIVAGFLKAINGNRVVSAFAIYSVFIFVTDNVATYLVYWICLVLLLRTDVATRLSQTQPKVQAGRK